MEEELGGALIALLFAVVALYVGGPGGLLFAAIFGSAGLGLFAKLLLNTGGGGF